MYILVVDDNKDICVLIENILLSEGYNVKSCSNPLEVTDMISLNQPELIITDMLMSGFDGRTLTKQMRENPKTADIKIMLMSAHPDAAKISIEIGVDEFLPKPFEMDDLLEKVQRLLN